MNVLALDSADQVLSAALTNGKGTWYLEIDYEIHHSEFLMEITDMLCHAAGLLPNKLNMVACMKGPGSFTGLRIGFSTAKGLSMALGIPFVSIPTLDCLAFHLSVWPGIVIPAIDSKKNCFFTALYQNGVLLTDYMDVSAETLVLELKKHNNKAFILTGSGAELLKSRLAAQISPEQIILDPQYRKGRARELLEIIKTDKIKTDKIVSLNNEDSGPLYLRKSDAELKRG